MSFIDTKFINLVSPQLDKFKRQRDGVYNFRCPYCGDSQKHKNKARGYLFQMRSDYVFICHNCGVGRTFTNFLKDHNSFLHDQYVMERYRSGLTGKNTQTAKPDLTEPRPVFRKQNKLKGLEKISALNKSHQAREYLENRKIEDLDSFYYCPKFKEWTNQQKKVFQTLRQDSARIIIPLKDKDGTMFGFQGRSLAPKAKIRYITVMLDESKPKVYGLDRIDPEKLVYVTEGPFDSHFLGNAIAMCGSDVDLSTFDYRFVFVYDNEPRNREIVKKIDVATKQGHKVVIWPSSVKEKDLNDMAMAGHNVQNMVELNTYQGLEAKLKFNHWKKV